jgi:HAD superfamily hydrolase (TIGR01509 family)
MNRALLFDFDGLIVDTEYPEFVSWREAAEAHGVVLTEEIWKQAVGHVDAFDPRSWLEAQVGRALDWESIDASRRARHLELVAKQPALPGVIDLMKQGRKQRWRIGVASNSYASWVESGLERLQLRGWVEAMRTRDTVVRPKPDPAPYVALLEDLSADPSRSIAFEDSAPGVQSAAAAGLRVVAVPNRLTLRQEIRGAWKTLPSLEAFQLSHEEVFC